MNKLILFLLNLLLIPILTFAQERESSIKNKVGANLEITTSVVAQKECLRESKLLPIRIDLKLKTKYANSGSYPIILHKKSGTIGREMVAHTQEDAESGQYEMEGNIDFAITSRSTKPEGDFPSEDFLILKPGDDYEQKAETVLFFFDLDGHPNLAYEHFSVNEHYAQFSIWTISGRFSYDNNLEELKKRWLNYGYLWTEGGRSKPMAMRFSNKDQLKKCDRD
ncbi:MAG: hypothetical protein HY231_05490 [Acidobacteria bacterium]|nr:hypothetical protein [Acidobacteriota bacterium]